MDQDEGQVFNASARNNIFLKAFKKNEGLEEVSFGKVESENIELLIDLLKENKKLKRMTFTSTTVSSDQVISIKSALICNKNLEYIDFGNLDCEVKDPTEVDLLKSVRDNLTVKFDRQGMYGRVIKLKKKPLPAFLD